MKEAFMQLPKVLIFGPPFNKRHGGGITLTNLFKGWPADRIALISTGHLMHSLSTDVCVTYYQLGNDEFKWHFPFNLFQKRFSSGPVNLNKQKQFFKRPSKSGLRHILVKKYFYPILEWIGLYHNASKLRLSNSFKKWLNDYDPQILYLIVSTRESVLFAQDLNAYLKIPSVIHMMDDWPSIISRRGPFKQYWHKKIDSELRQLLLNTTLCFSISNAMSIEYKNRYEREFIPFHNPIDVDFWESSRKSDYSIKSDHIKILYSGRIGNGITESLLELAQALAEINTDQIKAKLYIQSASADHLTISRLKKYNFVVINPVVDYIDLPAIFSSVDILTIVNDFDEKGIKFLKYSMPTKATEYMISGTPILVYSHAESAVLQFFDKNRCGYCVSKHDKAALVTSLEHLMNDENLRKRLGTNAARLASELFDGEKMRRKFMNSLIGLAQKT